MGIDEGTKLPFWGANMLMIAVQPIQIHFRFVHGVIPRAFASVNINVFQFSIRTDFGRNSGFSFAAFNDRQLTLFLVYIHRYKISLNTEFLLHLY